MAKGMSLHIGLNEVDPAHYAGWLGTLTACEFDANDMAAIAGQAGLAPTTLLTNKAKAKTVTDEIRRASAALASGDLFLLT